MHHITALNPQIDACYQQGNYEQALSKLAALRADMDNFFEQVMVNVDDAALKQNCLLILQMMATILSNAATILVLN